ncbi:hypothetical protein [Bradyrhizobium sp. BRP23]|uniref:hypothetical protein n=1 Tax=Bradyrhizobium sp. BRP23 TaxID=2793820 RepID=UPI001CD43F21|nr:hypothetical protein [Bradyrhizobium sp. BRP23]MCA1381307.1 hypothetical protein [Bradyrhizobium sp. BRP05]MCA1422436.1 hypothetical protein [Bradyrhizobium sp. BRP23]
MKLLRGLAASALALMLATTIAFAQVNPGTSPLSVPKGGTGAATAAGARSSLQVDRFTGQGNANYTILASDRVVGTNAAFTASRTWTLPAANAVNAGQALIVADFEGTVTSTNTLIIARAGSDTVNNGTSVTINAANGAYLLWSNGISKWTAQAIGSSAASGVSSLDGATGAISTQAGSLDVTGSTLSGNVLSSRAFALTQDLSAFSAIQTLGYATAGDGGGAIFRKIAGSFIDTRILTGTVTANGTSGCTNGTYRGVHFDGGTGRGADATVTVSGGVITSIANVGGYNGATAVGYSAGDVLSIGSDIPGCSGGKTWTVSTVTTPTGSFTDSAGNKWQIEYPAAGLDARSMGAKFDWDGTDGTATNNYTTLQNALSFAHYKTSTTIDGGGTQGGQVLLARQTAMFGCGATVPLHVPYGVKVKGQGNYSSVLKVCDTFDTSINIVELCNSFTHLACFGTLLEDFQLFVSHSVSGASSRSLVYTNNAQHESGLRRMAIYPGGCGRGATYETGYGGATYILLDSVEFKGGKSHANCGGANGPHVVINYGTTQVLINNLNVSGPSGASGGPRQDGISIVGGFVEIVGIHAEAVVNPVIINITGGITAGQVRARAVVGGIGCDGMFALTGTNTPGNFMLSPPMAVNGCNYLVKNSQSGGGSSHVSAASATDVVFTPAARAW